MYHIDAEIIYHNLFISDLDFDQKYNIHLKCFIVIYMYFPSFWIAAFLL